MWYGNLMEKLRKIAQETPITLESWLLSFVGIVLIRTFFEQFSNLGHTGNSLFDLPSLVHSATFYMAAVLIIMSILTFFGGRNIRESSVLGIFGLCIILLPPVIDLIVGGLGGHRMSYLFISGRELMLRFFTFFGGHISDGVTLGIQIEIVIIIVFIFLFIRYISKNNFKAFFSSLIVYCVLFALLTIPSLIPLVSNSTVTPQESFLQSVSDSHIIPNNIYQQYTENSQNLSSIELGFNKTMSSILVLITIVFGFIFFSIGSKEKLVSVLKNSRPERIVHYALLITFGYVLSGEKFVTWIDGMGFILTIISFISAWIFSVCENDIQDEKIDSISNKNRPLISKKLSRDDLFFTAKIFLIISLLSAYATSRYTLFFVVLYILIYHIYSTPPLHLKRFVFVNSFLISLASLSAVCSGFFLATPQKNITSFPLPILLGIIIILTLTSNIKDLKDITGDSADGIKTLPVLLGKKKSQIVLASMVSAFFLSIPYFLWLPSMLIPAIIASIFSWKFINQKEYIEWKFFTVYLLYFVLFICMYAYYH